MSLELTRQLKPIVVYKIPTTNRGRGVNISVALGVRLDIWPYSRPEGIPFCTVPLTSKVEIGLYVHGHPESANGSRVLRTSKVLLVGPDLILLCIFSKAEL